jgi:hypothetical protein
MKLGFIFNMWINCFVVVVVTQPPQVVVVSSQIRPGPNPMTMECPTCHSQIVTTTEAEAGALTWLACGGLALFG